MQKNEQWNLKKSAKVKGWRKIYYIYTNKNKPGVVIFISGGAEFRARNYIMITRSILHEDITFLKVYVPGINASKYMRQKLVKVQG